MRREERECGVGMAEDGRGRGGGRGGERKCGEGKARKEKGVEEEWYEKGRKGVWCRED